MKMSNSSTLAISTSLVVHQTRWPEGQIWWLRIYRLVLKACLHILEIPGKLKWTTLIFVMVFAFFYNHVHSRNNVMNQTLSTRTT